MVGVCWKTFNQQCFTISCQQLTTKEADDVGVMVLGRNTRHCICNHIWYCFHTLWRYPHMQHPLEWHYKNLDTPFKMLCGVSIVAKGRERPWQRFGSLVLHVWATCVRHGNAYLSIRMMLPPHGAPWANNTLSYHCMAFQAKLEDDYVKDFLSHSLGLNWGFCPSNI